MGGRTNNPDSRTAPDKKPFPLKISKNNNCFCVFVWCSRLLRRSAVSASFERSFSSTRSHGATRPCARPKKRTDLDFSGAPSTELRPRLLAERSQDWLGDSEDADVEVVGNEDEGGVVRVGKGAIDLDGVLGTVHGMEVEGEVERVVVFCAINEAKGPRRKSPGNNSPLSAMRDA